MGQDGLRNSKNKSISSKSKVYINHLLCPYYCYIWGKRKDMQRQSKNSKFPAKILHEKDLMSIQECPHEIYNNSPRLSSVPVISWAGPPAIIIPCLKQKPSTVLVRGSALSVAGY